MAFSKRFLKNCARKLGYDVVRYSYSSEPAVQLQRALQTFDIDLVIDIGANAGQFAAGLRARGYSGRIVSFEPLSEAHSALTLAAGRDPRWDVPSRCAIGDFDGHIDIHVAGNSVSSSVLPIMEAHTAVVPASAYVDKETVPVFRLDSIASDFVRESNRFFIKIDAQGFEWQVLDGAQALLKDAQGVLCELSLAPLYEGQRLWKDVVERLESEQFSVWAIRRGFTDLDVGRTLQVDVAFFRLETTARRDDS